jgi:hypothetical protein
MRERVARLKGASCPQPLPVGAQRRIGNRAVAALVQRYQDPNIADAAPGRFYSGGGYNWPVDFSLPAAASERGWIVQEITARLWDSTLAGAARDGGKQLHFWESWPVKKKKLVPKWRSPHDTYLWNSAVPGTTGTNRIDGTARFYTRTETGDWWWRSWPDGFEPNTVPEAGAIGSRTTKPAFWTGAGTDHSLVVTWTADGGANANPTPASKLKKEMPRDWME